MPDPNTLPIEPESLEAPPHQDPPRPVRLPAFALALILIPINIYWITLTEVRWYGTDGTCLPIFVTPVVLLFVLGLVNVGLRRIAPRFVLRQSELLIVYIMLAASSALAGQDTLQNLFGSIGYAEHGATPGSGWREIFFRYLPNQMLVSNKAALNGFYRGGVSPWQWDILKYWIGPLSMWALLLGILLAMMLSVTVILRRQWTDNERLTFPLVQLPLAMSGEQQGIGFYASRMMWAGFGIAVAIDLINGLHVLYPTMPYIVGIKKFNLGALFTEKPWSALGVGGVGFHLALFPFAIGMGFFMPLDLSFSCWFFFLARKLWQVFGAAQGWDSVSGTFPYFEEQAGGAWVAIGVMAVWGSRRHLGSVWRSAWSHEHPSAEEQSESRQYRAAILTILGGGVLLVVFSRHLGMAGWAAAAFFCLYFVLSTAMTKVRAELGSPHEIYFVNPARIMVSVLGTGAIGAANLTVMSTMYWFNRCYRSHPMPGQLEAMKMTDRTGISTRQVLGAIAVASVLGIVAAYWANLHITYAYGAEAKCFGVKSWTGYESYAGLSSWLRGDPRPEGVRIIHVLAGAVIVALLGALRSASVSWPFHPAGYALAVSFAMDMFWAPFLVAWMAKGLVTRYGGMKLHNRVAPAFLGLILGDFTMGVAWSIVGHIIGVQTYKIWI